MSWQHISESAPHARKPHSCCWYGESIPKGTVHRVFVGRLNGDLQTNRWHTECVPAFYAELKNDPYLGDDGWTPGSFPRGTLPCPTTNPATSSN